MKPKLVSIVAPFYNEEDGVGHFYDRLLELFEKGCGLEFEVICVNDGSQDDTLARLVELVDLDQRFRVLELSRNFGKEAALSAGIDMARGDAVIPIDADLQDPPDLILTLVEEWKKGYEVVLARRTDRSADSFMKRKTAELFYRFHNSVSSVKIPANVGDFRLMDRLVVDALKQLPERQRFMKGIFAWLGFKTSYVNYVRQPRAAGKTKFSGWKLWNFAVEGITSFSTAPLRIWLYIGGFTALVTSAYAVFMIVRTLVVGIEVPGYASLLVAILFFGSLQLLSLGILGEYLGRIYMESKQRPVYIIRKFHRGAE